MNNIQRAVRSVVRKPVKSILLLLVIVIITLFITSGIASANASIQTQDHTRQALGAGFQLASNENNRSKRIDDLAAKLGEEEGSIGGYHVERMETDSGIQTRTWTDNSFETLRRKDIDTLAAIKGIGKYNITTVVTAVNPVEFNRIEDDDTDQSGDPGGINLIGNLDMQLHSDVLAGNISLAEGRMVKKEDQNVCVISKELAKKNNLKLGDSIKFNSCSDPDKSKAYEAEIIGIYEGTDKLTPFMSGDTYRPENTVYTDLNFPEKAEGKENDPLYVNAYFQVKDVDQYEAVKKEIQGSSIDWERYDLIDNNGRLTTMASNFNDLKKISLMFAGAAVAAGFVILFLIFTFWIRNRMREIGILLAIGKTKADILVQILFEAFIITAAAFIISLAAVPEVSQATADYLVNQQVQQEETQRKADEGKVSTEYQEPEQEVTGVKVNIDRTVAAAGMAGITGLVCISVFTAGISIMKKKPKNILSEMS